MKMFLALGRCCSPLAGSLGGSPAPQWDPLGEGTDAPWQQWGWRYQSKQ